MISNDIQRNVSFSIFFFFDHKARERVIQINWLLPDRFGRLVLPKNKVKR